MDAELKRENVVCTRGEYRNRSFPRLIKPCMLVKFKIEGKDFFLREGKNNREIEKRM